MIFTTVFLIHCYFCIGNVSCFHFVVNSMKRISWGGGPAIKELWERNKVEHPPIQNCHGTGLLIQNTACFSSSTSFNTPDLQSDTTPSPSTSSEKASSQPIVIRTTRPNDLSAIVDLLSYETTKSRSSTLLPKSSSFPWTNWNAHLSKLKSHSNLHLQLNHRLSAKLALLSSPSLLDHRVKKNSNNHYFENDLSDSTNPTMTQVLNCIWTNNDTLRNKVERAVKTTLEFYKEDVSWWQDWNFALTPKHEMMFHYMMTASEDMECFTASRLGRENGVDGDGEQANVVGFCELMMLKRPILLQDGCSCSAYGEEVFVPCIVNLVVSPNHRRRGIGKRLVECAMRAVRLYGKEWNVDFGGAVGLFVEEDNVGAIALYEKLGFRVMGFKEEGSQNMNSIGRQIYMELSMVGDDGSVKDEARSSLMSRKLDLGVKEKERDVVMTKVR